MTKTDSKSWLLPDIFRKRHFIFWIMLLPQVLLLVLNICGWNLVQGEMSSEQRGMALTIFNYELVLLVAGILTWVVLWQRKKEINWIICVIMGLAQIGYLWLITAWLDNLLPETVTLWILPQSQFMYYQYALMMPALFYAGLRISCFNMPVKRWADISITIATLVFVPVAWFLLLNMSFSFFRWASPPFFFTMIFFVGSTVIILIAFLRMLLFLYAGLHRLRHGWFILPLVAGILAPLGGLILNRNIPFPYNFQDPLIYILTVANGVILLLPFRRDSNLGIAAWMARSVMFSFTLYFFIVFLPFLPVSLLAMIACGAGFLILAPTLLFIIHTRKLLDEGKQLSIKLGIVKTIALFIICVSVIPAGYTVRALVDKHSLMQAVDVVYSPVYKDGPAKINRSSAERSLLRLSEMKRGIYVPFLSNYYNKLVFSGMVLPDYKMEHIYKTLFGEKLPEGHNNGDFIGDLFSPRSRNWRQRDWGALPDRNVALVSVGITEEQENQISKTSVAIKMKNNGRDSAEFVTDIIIPDGVIISGYWLNVEGDRVPGRIFEKKTAMWVYHMIRDTERRDPGLLIFKSDNLAKLSVFPFASNQERITEIDFSFPTGMKPKIKIGSETVVLTNSIKKEDNSIFRFASDQNEKWILVPSTAAGKLPSVARKPYFHFIIDHSAKTKPASVTLVNRLKNEIKRMPEIGQCMITVANYEFEHLSSGLIPVEKAEHLLADNFSDSLPFQGGLCPERVIKSILLDYQESPPLSQNSLPMVPLFIVISADKTEIITDGEFSTFADIIPDSAKYYCTRQDGQLDKHFFDHKPIEKVSIPDPLLKTLVFRSGNIIRVCPAKTGGIIDLSDGGNEEIEIYDTDKKKFVPALTFIDLADGSIYGKGLSLWKDYKETVFEPGIINDVLPEIVRKSRDTGVMVPLTSYIVVENSAQWNMLKKKENQALAADHALEFDEFMESPAPSILYLVPILFVLLYSKKRKKLVKTEL